ncbi:heat shock protein HtpX [Actinomycetospora cinnamomea]|uniref:Protease HtpX homolog n=1 Tax=Actinomycetospora cinnamomea TaxID=663609 RepID=A0A2U1FS80_9PSEU|nr:heat shock protein HtpX [Actinomycetospora cinnamomea]
MVVVRGVGNGLKTAVLLGGLSALILLAGQWIGGTTGLLVAGLIALAMNGFSYFYSDRLALRAMRAVEVGPREAPGLHRMVRELSARAGMPMPRLYISPTSAPNAFATGRSPEHAAVCVTEGILGLLSERELRGVLGHEISHVGNRDVLIASVAAGLASMVMILANLAQLGALFGFGSVDDDGPGLLEVLLFALLGPVAAGLIQAAISRSREFEADASGARVTGDPLALAAALAKIERAARARPLVADGRTAPVSALMIANPFSAASAARWFSTHPDTAERIARLQAMSRGVARV